MKIAAVIFALIGAILLLVGVFLPWIHSSAFSMSGWDIARGEDFLGQGLAEIIPQQFISSNVHALIVFISAILAVVCVLLAFVLSLKAKGNNLRVVILGIIISLAAVATIGGLIGFMFDMNGNGFGSADWMQLIGYGVYVCAGGAILGLISGVLMAIRKKEKRTVRSKGVK